MLQKTSSSRHAKHISHHSCCPKDTQPHITFDRHLVFDRYNVVSETDLREAAERVEAYAQNQQSTADGYKTVTVGAFGMGGSRGAGR